jgi:acyl carrier protein
MNWFECLGKVLMDELTNIVSQPASPEEEIECYISEKRSTAMALNMTVGNVPPIQAKILKKQLAVLKKEIAEAEAKRDVLLRQLNKANNKLQTATGAVRSPFERMEEKVREAEEAAQIAHALIQQQNASDADLEQRFTSLETMNSQLRFEKLKKVIVEQLEVDPDTVIPQANFANDLNADQLDGIELVMAVEEEFDIDLPDNIAEHITTVQ